MPGQTPGSNLMKLLGVVGHELQMVPSRKKYEGTHPSRRGGGGGEHMYMHVIVIFLDQIGLEGDGDVPPPPLCPRRYWLGTTWEVFSFKSVLDPQWEDLWRRGHLKVNLGNTDLSEPLGQIISKLSGRAWRVPQMVPNQKNWGYLPQGASQRAFSCMCVSFNDQNQQTKLAQTFRSRVDAGKVLGWEIRELPHWGFLRVFIYVCFQELHSGTICWQLNQSFGHDNFPGRPPSIRFNPGNICYYIYILTDNSSDPAPSMCGTGLKITCSVRDQPEVWECALSNMDLGFLAPSLSFIRWAHSLLAALILAISM